MIHVYQQELPLELDDETRYFKGIPCTTWFVAYEDGDQEWAGIGGLKLYKTPYLGPTYVRPAHRGKGIQRKLIETRIDFCKKKNFSYLQSCADIANIWSRNNLEAYGFKEFHRGPIDIWYELEIK